MFSARRATRALTRLTHSVGVDVRRWPRPDPWYTRLSRIFAAAGIDTVLDVGANVGQYAQRLRNAGWGGRIVSIEPCLSVHAALAAAAVNDPFWTVAPAMALGDRDGEAELIVYNRSDMSSLRPLAGVGLALFPRLAETGREMRPLRRLDGVFSSLAGEGSAALKLDTQGAERDILIGADAVFDRIVAVQVELALDPLYDGAPAAEEVYDMLRTRGLRIAMTNPVNFDKKTGRPIEVDALFLR